MKKELDMTTYCLTCKYPHYLFKSMCCHCFPVIQKHISSSILLHMGLLAFIFHWSVQPDVWPGLTTFCVSVLQNEDTNMLELIL